MLLTEIIGAWLAAFLTLSILSFLFRENPLYKIAEHLFVGTSAGWGVVIAYWQVIDPNLINRLFPDDPSVSPEFKYIIPLILGLLMLTRLVPKLYWLARFSIAYIVGVFAGLRAYAYLNSDIYGQVIKDPFVYDSVGSFISSVILLLGTIAALVYFFFSKKHEGAIGKIGKVGIYFLMVSFGASFGFTVIGRISLLIGRFDDMIQFSQPQYYYGTLWCLGAVIIMLLFYFYIKGSNNTTIEKN